MVEDSTNGHLASRRCHIFPNTPDQKRESSKGRPSDAPASSHQPDDSHRSDAFQRSASPQRHLQWGLALYAQGHTQQALWDFFESVGAEPRNSLGHYMCGLALKALGLSDEAQAEWEMVLTLASEEEVPSGGMVPSVEIQWARSMAYRLLAGSLAGDAEYVGRNPPRTLPPSDESPAIDAPLKDVAEVGPANGCGGACRQDDLESAIRDTVRCHGGCSVKDQFISDQLEVTTEEQVLGWKQSFSAREGLECQPYQAMAGQDCRHDGVVFSMTAAASEQLQSRQKNDRLARDGSGADGQSPALGSPAPGEEEARC